jgi:hypothetical protein
MPNFDRTGPQGAGPMTGGARGLCGRRRGVPVEDPVSGQGAPGRQRGGGKGRGFGRGFGRSRHQDATASPLPMVPEVANADPTVRRAVLKAERNRLKSRLSEVEETLKAIGRGTADDTDA